MLISNDKIMEIITGYRWYLMNRAVECSKGKENEMIRETMERQEMEYRKQVNTVNELMELINNEERNCIEVQREKHGW